MPAEVKKTMSITSYRDQVPWKVEVKSDHVDVWCVSLDLPLDSRDPFQQILSQEERVKARRFRSEKARNRFVAARCFLRRIIAPYTGVKPEDLRFQYGPHGKPALAKKSGNAGICFNMSHSHGLALYAVTTGRAVGVDIEKIRPDPDCIRIAENYFSPGEIEALRKLVGDQQRRGFFNCWTRKEAYLKAKGEGFSFPFDQFAVSLIPGETAALLYHRAGPLEVSKWSIEDLDAGPDYAAALAVEVGQAGESDKSKHKTSLSI
jgi:4'-phosphopantetheinyl transferase